MIESRMKTEELGSRKLLGKDQAKGRPRGQVLKGSADLQSSLMFAVPRVVVLLQYCRQYSTVQYSTVQYSIVL